MNVRVADPRLPFDDRRVNDLRDPRQINCRTLLTRLGASEPMIVRFYRAPASTLPLSYIEHF